MKEIASNHGRNEEIASNHGRNEEIAPNDGRNEEIAPNHGRNEVMKKIIALNNGKIFYHLQDDNIVR